MAGNYPDAPSRRIAWDDDGTLGLILVNGNMTLPTAPADPDAPLGLMTATQRQQINNENNDGILLTLGATATGGIFCYLIFPDLRDIDAFYWNLNGTGIANGWMRYSTDTTNGYDGTFTAFSTQAYSTADVVPDYRTDIEEPTAVTSVKGIKFGLNSQTSLSVRNIYLRAMHLYGTPSAGANADRLIFLDTGNSDAEYTLPIDDGDEGRGESSAFNLKVKNNSSTKQANTVQITAEALSLDSDDWYTFATTELGTYSATLQLGNITSGSSVTVYVKKDIDDAEVLGTHVSRFKVSKASWT